MRLPVHVSSGLPLRLCPRPSPFSEFGCPNGAGVFDILRRGSAGPADGRPVRDWRAYADPPGTTYDPTIPFRDWEDEKRGMAFDPRWKIDVPQRPKGMTDKLWEKKKRTILRKMKKYRFDEGGELRGIRITQTSVPLRIRDRLIADGMKMQAQFQIGRYGISDMLVKHIRSAWRVHEIVRLTIASPWKDNMQELVKRLERKTGGIVLDRAGSRMLLYRGFTDMDLARKGILDPYQFEDDEEAKHKESMSFVELPDPEELEDRIFKGAGIERDGRFGARNRRSARPVPGGGRSSASSPLWYSGDEGEVDQHRADVLAEDVDEQRGGPSRRMSSPVDADGEADLGSVRGSVAETISGKVVGDGVLRRPARARGRGPRRQWTRRG